MTTTYLVELAGNYSFLKAFDNLFDLVSREVVDIWSGVYRASKRLVRAKHHIYRLTLLLYEMFNEALLIVALGDDVDEDVVLLPHSVNLVVLVLNDGALAMPSHALLHVLFLSDVLGICVRESCSQVVQHLYLLWFTFAQTIANTII